MTSEEKNYISMKVPEFDSGNFFVWWRRFKAYATIYKFEDALNEVVNPNLPAKDSDALDPSNSADVAKIRAKKQNAAAMAAFTLSFTTEAAMAFVDGAATKDWPNGRADLVVVGLFNHYRPQDIMSEAEMERDIMKIKMRKNQDPAVLFTQIAAIEMRYKTQLSLEKKLGVLLSKAPSEYTAVITSEQRLRSMNGGTVTMEELRSAMGFQYRALAFGPSTDRKDSTNDELTMSLINEKKKGPGKPGKKKKPFNGKCHHCGKKHKAEDCWLLHPEKQPAWLKKMKAKREKKKVPPTELGNTVVDDGDHIEFLCTAMVRHDKTTEDDLSEMDGEYCLVCNPSEHENGTEIAEEIAFCTVDSDLSIFNSDESSVATEEIDVEDVLDTDDEQVYENEWVTYTETRCPGCNQWQDDCECWCERVPTENGEYVIRTRYGIWNEEQPRTIHYVDDTMMIGAVPETVQSSTSVSTVEATGTPTTYHDTVAAFAQVSYHAPPDSQRYQHLENYARDNWEAWRRMRDMDDNMEDYDSDYEYVCMALDGDEQTDRQP